MKVVFFNFLLLAVFLYLPSLFQTFFFALILEIFSFYGGIFWLFLFLFILFSVLTFRLVTKSWEGIYVTFIFSLAVWSILHLIDYSLERHIFIFISSLVNYFLLFGIYRIGHRPDSRTAKGVVAMSMMAVVFLFFSATYGIYLNFEVASWWLMTFYFVNIVIITYQYFLLIAEKRKRMALIYSLVIGFSVLELGWIVNFWPFSYLTTGVILLMFYYILWDLSQNYFLNILSIKNVFINLIFFVIIASMVLYSSIWLPNI